MSNLSKAAVIVAVSQIGQQEHPKGSNWGHPVQDYLASVGIKFPAAWCMAFVYWCFNEAARKLAVSNTAVRTAGCLAAWNTALPSQKTESPSEGSVFIMDFGRGQGHTGIVEKFDATHIWTIEGNTNSDGSREGYIVCRRKRARSAIKGYLNY